MDAERVQLLIDTLTQKRDCCRHLLELATRQQEPIRSGEMHALMEVLGNKQRVLGRMEEVQRRLAPLADLWQSRRETLEPDARNHCEELLTETEQLLARLIEQEKLCEQGLIQMRKSAMEQLQEADSGSKLNEAYSTASASESRRIVDLEIE